ncbi:serine protease [Streptacidiphilus sp. EB129]|jgi:V8-like Glu-specific endopeptidase|uniref:trypsin-like serine peptidase n=1 Tax=Streptacidiphilus sp. EB129 TaxID=3156262 RepID=UPI00351439F7
MTHLTHRSLALALLVGAGAALGTVATPAPGTASALAPMSTAFTGAARVGALFSTVGGRLAGHFCTASVVDSPGHDLLVTAAHCAVQPGSGRARSGLVFVPGYRDGMKPYGAWSVTRVVVGGQWARRGNPDYDVAFLTTRPLHGNRQVQDVVGSEAISFDHARHGHAVAVGYPHVSERPVFCGSALHSFGRTQLEFDCPGLPGGTSGGPLLTGAAANATGRGSVVGIIGGYQQGGATADISYSPYFGPGIAAVYRTALNQR